MKLAVLSDIHGNLTALNAVLKDINRMGVDKYIIAGDHIVDCPQPNEVLEKIKNLNAYVIKGNREQYVIEYHKGMHNEWNNHKQMAAVLWTHNVLNEQNIKYIDELSEQVNISFPEMDDIRVVHGSPFHINEELFPHKHPERLEKTLKGIEESVLICGHTHQAWSKISYNKFIVNPGSVGVPFNKNKFAEYAVLTWEHNKWTVSQHQVQYNLNELENTFNESGILQKSRAWSRLTLESIKQGKNITLDFIKYAYKLAENSGFNNLELVPDCIWDKAEQLWFEK
ncbi:MAG: metallophosphoesterase [Clostridiaceae bacterium]|jgi:putative phosphoesterase|nr:metallophosphoesterase [Clostridiaceae bacterium]